MTRDASPATVKGDFNNAFNHFQGLTTRFTREGDTFFMETISPAWALDRARAEGKANRPPETVKLSVDRLVGSHWLQECLHKEKNGQFSRLPVLYHITEQRWVHSNGAFLIPDSDDFWQMCRGTVWNETCLFCHNTGPSKNPVPAKRGEEPGFKTQVAELGISCEACHGPGGEHVKRNSSPARRLTLQQAGRGDPSVVHPERLSVERRDEICARCHGALVPKAEAWDRRTARDPFIAGQDLSQFNHKFTSEAEQAILFGKRDGPKPAKPEPNDGRFWGDGTPLTTALEYNGMILSACYEKGKGSLSCLSCHTMHGDDPNFMLKPGMKTNEACYQCHNDYRGRLVEHTQHPADSSGSLCYNCHMPHQVYSLMTTHRSHRIQNPDIADSMGTGKPHACNLCHLDKSLGWTKEQLSRRPGGAKKEVPQLSADEENIASSVHLMATGDARTRVIVAGAFSNPDAQRASGTDWFAPFLTRLMGTDRYPAVRYLSLRGLRSVHGPSVETEYDFLARPPERLTQLKALRDRLDGPVKRPYPQLPLTPSGLPDEAILRRLLGTRTDPDLSINE